MKKILQNMTIAIGLTCVLLLISSCAEMFPTGNLVPGPGSPGGATATGSFPSFDINNMPTPKFWNDRAHNENFPPLFQFANGGLVTNLTSWEHRAEEIKKIIQHYEYGYLPPQGKDVLTVTYEDGYVASGTKPDAETARTSTTRITMKYKANASSLEKTATLDVGIRYPTSNKSKATIGSNDKYPVLINIAGGSNPGTTWGFLDSAEYDWAVISYNVGAVANESNHSGVVKDLYGYDYVNDLDAPGALMAWAWGVGRVLDAIENGAFGGRIDPDKVAITGMSRWGKGSMLCGAFSESQNGLKIAVTDLGSAGAGGPALDRFILSPLGLTAYNQTTAVDAKGKTLYLKYIDDDNNLRVTNKKLVVKAVVPDILGGTDAYDFTYNGWTSGETWHGIESLTAASDVTPGWFSRRFFQFTDRHASMNVDHVVTLPLRTPRGPLCQIPYDQYFLASLIAPRGVFYHDGFQTIRNNPEGQALNWMITDQVYDLYSNGDKAKNYNAIKFYHITHSQPDYEIYDLWEFGKAYYAQTSLDKRFREPPYPITDPRSRVDYLKVNWKGPLASKTIAELASEGPDPAAISTVDGKAHGEPR